MATDRARFIPSWFLSGSKFEGSGAGSGLRRVRRRVIISRGFGLQVEAFAKLQTCGQPNVFSFIQGGWVKHARSRLKTLPNKAQLPAKRGGKSERRIKYTQEAARR